MRATWEQPLKNTDGTTFDVAQYAGYSMIVDGKPAVSVPVPWASDGKYSFDLAALPMTDGQHALALAVVAKNGSTSEYTAPVTFTAARQPKAPFGLAVS